MKITLKNVKYAKFASEETPCFSATVYANGEKIGFANNSGTGGETTIRPDNAVSRDDLNVIDAALKAEDVRPGPDAEDFEREMYDKGYRNGLEDAVMRALDDYLAVRDLKRLLARKALAVVDGKLLAYSGKPMPALYVAIATKEPDAKILNILPFDEALALYRKYG